MKKIYSAFLLLSLFLMTQSCNKDLPYPIDEVKRGVVIDILRSSDTDGVLYRDETDGNYKVKLVIPEQQGDYSFMKNAQLLAVLERVLPDPTKENPSQTKTVTESRIVAENITQFPQEIAINIADVYSKFGLTAPDLGETLSFTTNVVLQDGSIIPGWTKETGYNNKAFAGWQVDGRSYSYRVRYSVVCALDLDAFVGTCTVTDDEWWGETPYQVEVTKVGDYQLSISGLYNGEATNPLLITINPVDYSISFDKQILVPNSGTWWGNSAYNNFALSNGTGTVNACETTLTFSGAASVSAGSFSGTQAITLGK